MTSPPDTGSLPSESPQGGAPPGASQSAASRSIEVLKDSAAVASRGAELFALAAQSAVEERGRFSVALSGGSTPRAMYELLAQEPLRSTISWDRVHLFWGDERCVPPDHPDSNYGMANETLVKRVPVPAEQVHRLRGETEDPEEEARAYELELRRAVGEAGVARVGVPLLDLVYLGLGSNGHTASLFPHRRTLIENDRLVLPDDIPGVGRRLTLTAPAINTARQVVVLVVGEDKAAVLARILQGPPDFERLPAQLIAPRPGQLIWLLDEAAAVRLSGQR